ncbi:12364_t:CDS:2 [Funneliformis mosseae]|uniref:12364_t:CDS:1 n=1 Tax=Funneliformis mosseae TaxID=27381 RepID=A0A9N8V236_FUNMO|nr:12364_t:CDS:2 [Funneliformis mosseae]
MMMKRFSIWKQIMYIVLEARKNCILPSGAEIDMGLSNIIDLSANMKNFWFKLKDRRYIMNSHEATLLIPAFPDDMVQNGNISESYISCLDHHENLIQKVVYLKFQKYMLIFKCNNSNLLDCGKTGHTEITSDLGEWEFAANASADKIIRDRCR